MPIPAINAFPLYAAPFSVVFKRLLAHQEADRLLHGLSFITDLKASEIIGEAQLPALRIMGVFVAETHAPGSRPSGQGMNNTPQKPLQTLQINLYTSLRAGMVQMNPVNEDYRTRGHTEWIARIFDAIETNEDGEAVDALLENTMMQPVMFRTQPGESDGLYYESVIFVECYCRNTCRGLRHTLFTMSHPE